MEMVHLVLVLLVFFDGGGGDRCQCIYRQLEVVSNYVSIQFTRVEEWKTAG